MKFFLSTLTLLMVTLASADKASLIANIKAQLQMGGAYNCQYKCANLFNIASLWDGENGNIIPNGMTSGESVSILNEYLGCVAGCGMCNGGKNGNCMAECKNKNWFNTVWWYNPHSGGTKLFEVDQDLVQRQFKCVQDCGVPSTGGRAILEKSYTDCTTACYNDPVSGIFAINGPVFQACTNGATCEEVNKITGACMNAAGKVIDVDVTERYDSTMCGQGVLKNIVEPDKACQFGCVQNLCQTGAGCLGKGYWSAATDNAQCQVITPQAKGEKYTIVPSIFNNSRSDIAGCCSQSRVCCSYKESWAKGNARQRVGVCTVANNEENCGDPLIEVFNIKNYTDNDISKGKFPGKGCDDLWKPKADGGVCEIAGFNECPECRQDNHE